ncbi:hypothetical protein [Chromobacterium vaccinii]
MAIISAKASSSAVAGSNWTAIASNIAGVTSKEKVSPRAALRCDTR